MVDDDTDSVTSCQAYISSPSSSLNINALSNLHQATSIAEQSNIDLSNLTENSTFNKLPHILIGQRKFIKEDHLHKKRKRTSWIKKYGTYLLEINTSGKKDKTFWSCDRCDTRHLFTLYAAEATSNSISHLQNKHQLYEHGKDKEQNPPSKRHPTSVLDMQRRAITCNPIVKLRAESFKSVLLRWMVDANEALGDRVT
ncbi:hypothetical protein NEOLI_005045 [Neolecta irregularis DAH-3]|uniref:BED-type domain-containing protein n=1 Tax=Neolecta irregularis (strain DAH-3) TaxID=1198029 RepID=A0A1U7LI62_NEOID|nr:hypothetical protein NEOLI_005045 [Neolecta irregularis DAH-3]|eukprot:OLL22350.1 hypothetical protein NEOLI_005045 [Neolecta irregularis DAH-3]